LMRAAENLRSGIAACFTHCERGTMSSGRNPRETTTHRAIWLSLVLPSLLRGVRGGLRLSFLTVKMFSAWASVVSWRFVSPDESLT